MNNQSNPVPVVLSFSSVDPTGGTGLHADIEAIGAQGCHCAPIICSIVPQDSVSIHRVIPLSSSLVTEQARAILEDMPIRAIKVGFVGSSENIQAIHSILRQYAHIPVVLDPLFIGPEMPLYHAEMIEAMRLLILPLTTVCVMNTETIRGFVTGADSLEACAHELLATELQYVLLTGQHELTPDIINRLYGHHRLLQTAHWPRFPMMIRGADCTLTASIAALLAQGMEHQTAVYRAQAYTWDCLSHHYRIGMGHPIANRLFWAKNGLKQGSFLT